MIRPNTPHQHAPPSDTVYHFAFTGREPVQATVSIKDRKIDVHPGQHGVPQVTVTADSEAWIRFVRRERPLWRLLVRGHLRLRPWRDGARLLSVLGPCLPRGSRRRGVARATTGYPARMTIHATKQPTSPNASRVERADG